LNIRRWGEDANLRPHDHQSYIPSQAVSRH